MGENNQKHAPEDVSARMKLMASIFQKDAQILDLENEKIQLLQKLYEQEMKMYGRMSKIGKEIFEVEHCEVLKGRVRQMTESEWKENLEPKMVGKQTEARDIVHKKLNYYNEKQQSQSNTHKKEVQKRETPELV